MAADYTITHQTRSRVRQSDGTYATVVNVGYKTKSDPPVTGEVEVPASLLSDAQAFVAAVKAAVGQAVAAHNAVANL